MATAMAAAAAAAALAAAAAAAAAAVGAADEGCAGGAGWAAMRPLAAWARGPWRRAVRGPLEPSRHPLLEGLRAPLLLAWPARYPGPNPYVYESHIRSLQPIFAASKCCFGAGATGQLLRLLKCALAAA
jgi:hypothetical protein